MIRRTIKIVAALLVGFFVLFLAVNSWDEEIKPEAKAVIDQKIPPTENGLKAYYYLLGLRIGEDKEAEGEGRALWTEAQKIPDDQRGKFYDQRLKRKDGVWPSLSIPPRQKGQTLTDFLNKARKSPNGVLEHKQLTDHYLKLIILGEYSAPEFNEVFSRADTPVQELLKGHRLLTFHLGELAEQELYEKVERVIRDENRFYQSFFGRSHLLGVMIAHLIIHDNADILAAEKKKNPNLKFKPETIASFQTPSAKEMMTGAMNNEFRIVAKMIRVMGDVELISNFSDPAFESLYGVEKFKTHLLIKPNATINRNYDQIQAQLRRPCEEDCLWDKTWWQQGFPFTAIRNPGGKWITNLLMIHTNHRAKKMERWNRDLAENLARLKHN